MLPQQIRFRTDSMVDQNARRMVIMADEKIDNPPHIGRHLKTGRGSIPRQPTNKMGYIRHDAIIATSCEENHLNAARAKAEEIGLTCSEIVASPNNFYKSFVIVPDGSKEGLADSDKGIAMRAEWVAWMRGGHRVEEPCMWVDWAHVNFGGDDDELSTLADHSGISSHNTPILPQ